MIRADASPRIGGGHVSRCMALAHRLGDAGWDCSLATHAETFSIFSRDTLPLPATVLDASDEPAQLRKVFPDGCDLLITDHYRLDSTFESACRDWATHILAIDDLADRPHDADWLLDQTPGRDDIDYAPLVPPQSRMLLGADYALLRPEFARMRAAAQRPKDKLAHILITFGASDPHDMTGLALNALRDARIGGTVDIVMGADDCRRERLENILGPQSSLKARYHQATKRMAELMRNADVCIGAGGVTALERCCLGLPSLIIQTADNQAAIVSYLHAAGAARHLGSASDARHSLAEKLTAEIRQLATDMTALNVMSQTGMSICDGRGTWRVLLALLASSNEQPCLRLAEDKDTDRLYAWQTAPGMRQHFRNPQHPSRPEHNAWMRRSLLDPDRLLLIIETATGPSGMIRLDGLSAQDPCEVSILVAPECQGRGIGHTGLRLASQLLPGRDYRAEVHVDNLASQRLFRAAGYQQTSPDTYLLPARLS
ncbi:MAG: UDP-2,4-diacetamido-2,4,6-trideoxy-beta-L-altropyranose hydrolase [Alphaproteobacteria bacterium]|nr:UDP-2,4-diacetamido-2,4,6-trideoxy-beta-L-altropyranose hydrolase [Alphaproteobacteria bacterium]